jgi:hypothetical protein
MSVTSDQIAEATTAGAGVEADQIVVRCIDTSSTQTRRE